MSTSAGEGRICPLCGQLTDALRCADDDIATFSMAQGLREAGSYRAGERIQDRYELTGMLGSGGFGAVFSAVHLVTRQAVAIKMLTLKANAANRSVMLRFFREARTTAQLSSTHTVRVFDTGQIDGGPLYIAMEHLRGPTLEQVLQRLEATGSTMRAEQAVDLAGQLLKSLAEAHAAGLVHRDLKPANVIIADGGGGDRIAKVLDFGIARTVDSDLTATGRVMGTPHYMSPEQFRAGAIDGRGDLYALGVVLFRCLAGRLPFGGDTPYQIMHSHLHEAVPSMTATAKHPIPAGVEQAIVRALDKDATKRFATAQEMRRALLDAVRGDRRHRSTLAWTEGLPLRSTPRDGPRELDALPPRDRATASNTPAADAAELTLDNTLSIAAQPVAQPVPLVSSRRDAPTMGLDPNTLDQLALEVAARGRLAGDQRPSATLGAEHATVAIAAPQPKSPPPAIALPAPMTPPPASAPQPAETPPVPMSSPAPSNTPWLVVGLVSLLLGFGAVMLWHRVSRQDRDETVAAETSTVAPDRAGARHPEGDTPNADRPVETTTDDETPGNTGSAEPKADLRQPTPQNDGPAKADSAQDDPPSTTKRSPKWLRRRSARDSGPDEPAAAAPATDASSLSERLSDPKPTAPAPVTAAPTAPAPPPPPKPPEPDIEDKLDTLLKLKPTQ